MLISLKKITSILIIIITVFIACNNSNDTPPPKTDQTHVYDDWKSYTYENIKIFYDDGFSQKDNLYEIVKKMQASIRIDCQFLNIPIPTDTITIYFYSGLGQGREVTGQRYSHAVDDTMHIWLPSFYGTTIMKYLLPKWEHTEPQYKFLKEGLITLMDHSGQNYHKSTFDLIDSGKFVPLVQLAEDTIVNSDMERIQSSFSASFVDFIVYYYGIDLFRVLYKSRGDFSDAVNGIFKISPDSLQNLWLNVIRQTGVADKK